MHHPIRRRTLPALAAALAMLATLLTLAPTPAGAQPGASITIVPLGNQVLDAGNPACIQMRQTGGDGDIAWSAAGLPFPLTINANGLIEGTPVAAGRRTVTVTATDEDGDTATRSFAMEAVAPSGPVVKAGRLETGFTIDCTSQEGGAATNQFLSDIANFGPSGTYRLGGPLVIASQTAFTPPVGGARITEAYLSDADVLMDGWVRDGRYSRKELRLIREWVEDGGVLVAAEDWFGADQLARLFGVTMAPNAWLGCHEDVPARAPVPSSGSSPDPTIPSPENRSGRGAACRPTARSDGSRGARRAGTSSPPGRATGPR